MYNSIHYYMLTIVLSLCVTIICEMFLHFNLFSTIVTIISYILMQIQHNFFHILELFV